MKQQSFFDSDKSIYTPLASKLRPYSFEHFVGQEHIIGEGRILSKIIEADKIPSMIFWGPPGVGKTTLAEIIAEKTTSEFIRFSAVSSSISDVKKAMKQAADEQHYKNTIIFIDEIHRFNKAQQDAFLPFVESGSITLIGATTENPSFEINSALLSRCRVFVLNALSTDEIKKVIFQAIDYLKENENIKVNLEPQLAEAVAVTANGDARAALNTLEIIINNTAEENGAVTPSEELVKQCVGKRVLRYDKDGEEHYNLISALHKSMRNSDADAAVYWLIRMLEGGEEPLYIARRIIRFASEDIGMADSNALLLAVSAYQACHFNGMPECSVNLVHAAVYCSLAPKSNSLYLAEKRAREDAKTMLNEDVPLVIRNDVTPLMKDLGYLKGYQYNYNEEYKMFDLQCLPEKLQGRKYYTPTQNGREKKFAEIKQRIEDMKNQMKEQQKKQNKNGPAS
ncbi:MAG: replication-associated recombination protein A [Clostridiales bacterium]|nr:replication-associated recombination protein A [Clostridiales bacterium]